VAFARTSGLQQTLVYLLPLAALGIIFGNSFSAFSNPLPLQQTGEPRTTQEAMRGRPATREALTLYFGLVAVGLLISLLLTYAFFFQP
jgi:hypothetical protein